MHLWTINSFKLFRMKLFEIKLFVLIAALLLLINLTGDHVFNKVNNLKVLLVMLCIILLSICTLFCVRTFNIRLLVLLILPIIVMLLGALLSNFQFSYGLPFELTSQVLCVIWAFLLYSLMLTHKVTDTWKVMWVFIPTIYFVCLIALVEKLGWSPLINIPLNPFEASTLLEPWQYRGLAGRVESTFGNINYFANFLIQVLPITFAIFLISKSQVSIDNRHSRIPSAVALLSSVLVLSVLIMTETRSAIFSAMISMSLFMLLLARIGVVSKPLVIRLGLLTVISIVIILLIKMGLDTDRFGSLFKKETWWPRTIPWQTAWDSFKSAPLFGHGIGASYPLFFEHVSPDSRLFSGNRSYNHVHNEILQVLQEGGVFGLAVYLVFWSTPVWLGIKHILNNNRPLETRILVSALISGLLAYHIHGLFSVAPRMISSRLIAYSLLAILLAIIFRPQYDHSALEQKRGNRFFIFTVILISLIVISNYFMPFLRGQFQYVSALTHSDRSTQLAELASNSNDIYILEASAKEAFDEKDIDQLLLTTSKASEIFPHYRAMDVYHAFALYWSGDMEAAYSAATKYQVRDRYNSLVNVLLLRIAIERSSEQEVLNQLAKPLEYQACNNHLMTCEALNVKVVSGQFALPFQIIDKGERWNVLVDKSFLMMLMKLQQKSSGMSINEVDTRSLILKSLSEGNFFKPEAITSRPINQVDYERLTQYLVYLNNMESDRQKLELKEMLEKKLNLTKFLQKRALLINLSNTIFNAIK